jgi:Na+-driven multidrug efflux pump
MDATTSVSLAASTMLGQKMGDKKMDLFKKAYAERNPDVNACGEK